MTPTSRFAAAGFASLLLLAAAAPAGAANQAVYDEGSWYFDALSVGDAHAAGFTGEGSTIAVIDSPLNLEVPALTNADIELYDGSLCFLDDAHTEPTPATSTETSGQLDATHGTNVVSFIVGSGEGYDGQKGVRGVAPDARILAYAMPLTDAEAGDQQVDCKRPGAEGNLGASAGIAEAMNDAIDKGADIISVSMLLIDNPETDQAYIRALREGVVVVGGLTNTNGVELQGGFPGTANGAVSVQAIDSEVNILSSNGFPNENSYTDIVAPGIDLVVQGTRGAAWQEQSLGSGTSYATPIVAGFLAVVKQKYPEATGNQLIQSLIHNTGRDDGEAVLDDTNTYGYGTASLTVMLANDPTQYPDENPLISDDGFPTPEMIAAQPSDDPSVTPETPGETAPVGGIILTIALVVGGLILIGIIVLVVVLTTRRKRTATRTENRS